MYSEFKTWNWGIGCNFPRHCIYCKKSFQNLVKRGNPGCQDCGSYSWHVHLDRLTSSKVPHSMYVFPAACGEISFASMEEVGDFLEIAGEEDHEDQIFVPQSKNPSCFLKWEQRFIIPRNIVFATTIESNETSWIQPGTTRVVHYNNDISGAPPAFERRSAMMMLRHKRKSLTIEPVLKFVLGILVEWAREIRPEFVYVGYANHGYRLPEPRLSETMELIEELEKFTEVRRKTLRKSWWEE
jgi:hypothetical protein